MCLLVLLVKEIISFLEDKYPPDLAFDWDNVGLQIGDVNAEVKKVMIALEATSPVVEEAVAKGVDLLITHHPFFFTDLKFIDLNTPKGKNIAKLIKNGINLYSLHTNYDIADDGMNDLLARKIGLKNIKPFSMIDDVHGLGRIGEFETERALYEFYDDLAYEWLAPVVRYVMIVDNDVEDRKVKKIAIIGGKGGQYLHDAKNAGADVFVTGDVDYHTAVEAKEIGLIMVDIGHHAEAHIARHIASLLFDEFAVEAIVPTTSENPFR